MSSETADMIRDHRGLQNSLRWPLTFGYLSLKTFLRHFCLQGCFDKNVQRNSERSDCTLIEKPIYVEKADEKKVRSVIQRSSCLTGNQNQLYSRQECIFVLKQPSVRPHKENRHTQIEGQRCLQPETSSNGPCGPAEPGSHFLHLAWAPVTGCRCIVESITPWGPFSRKETRSCSPWDSISVTIYWFGFTSRGTADVQTHSFKPTFNWMFSIMTSSLYRGF